MSRARFRSLTWRSRSQPDLAAKWCPPHNLFFFMVPPVYECLKLHANTIRLLLSKSFWTSMLSPSGSSFLCVFELPCYLHQGQVSWRECSTFSLTCFLISAAHSTIDPQASWFLQLKSDTKKFYEHVQMTGADRLSQAGELLWDAYSLPAHRDGLSILIATYRRMHFNLDIID